MFCKRIKFICIIEIFPNLFIINIKHCTLWYTSLSSHFSSILYLDKNFFIVSKWNVIILFERYQLSFSCWVLNKFQQLLITIALSWLLCMVWIKFIIIFFRNINSLQSLPRFWKLMKFITRWTSKKFSKWLIFIANYFIKRIQCFRYFKDIALMSFESLLSTWTTVWWMLKGQQSLSHLSHMSLASMIQIYRTILETCLILSYHLLLDLT